LGNINSIFNYYQLIYKIRPDSTGNYVVSAFSSDLERLKLRRLNLYKGSCSSKEWLGYIDFPSDAFKRHLITKIPIDSIDKNTNYYLEWEFGVYGDLIREFEWNLKYLGNSPVSIQEPDSVQFSISKNPNNGHFEIYFPEVAEVSIIEIYNLSGQIIYTQTVQAKTSRFKVNIAVHPSGVYSIKFRNSTINETMKIIVNH
jgi:hypothetical protein